MEKKKNDLALVSQSDLSLVDGNILNEKQLKLIMKKTPAQFVHKRPAKGGGQWDFVTGGYVKKVLNLMFGWDWDFQVINFDMNIQAKQTIVHGQLTCRTNGKTIIKHQFGRADIKFRKNTEIPLDLGNDLKAATTDALKKCASELGIAADIYNKADFKAIEVVPDITKEMIMELYMEKQDQMNEDDQSHIDRIIQNEETASYKKAYKFLTEK
jgi:hypothetical protein